MYVSKVDQVFHMGCTRAVVARGLVARATSKAAWPDAWALACKSDVAGCSFARYGHRPGWDVLGASKTV